jgi:carbamate kinase
VRIVVALGGNALLERDERPDAAIQRRHVRQAAAALAPLTDGHQLVLCHGNGPQIGVLALESQADTSLSRPYPLDVLVAQTQGMIGYWLVQELGNAGAAQRAVCVLSQTVVDPADPAFGNPSKFIGPGYDQAEAQAMAARLGWTVRAEGRAGAGWWPRPSRWDWWRSRPCAPWPTPACWWSAAEAAACR